MFSTNELLLVVYFICILDYGYDVRQKVNSSDFSFKFKMDHKAAETTWNINDAFGLGTAGEWTVQWRFKNLCKGDEKLEDEKCIGQPLEVDNDPLRTSLKLILLKQDVSQELSIDQYMVVLHLKQIGNMRKLNKWVTHKLTTNKKKIFLEVSSSLILCNKEPFLNWIVTWDKKWILKDNQW